MNRCAWCGRHLRGRKAIKRTVLGICSRCKQKIKKKFGIRLLPKGIRL